MPMTYAQATHFERNVRDQHVSDNNRSFTNNFTTLIV